MWYRQAKKHTSIMIALYPKMEQLKKIELPEYLQDADYNEMHLTLFIVGEAQEYADDKQLIHKLVEGYASKQKPFQGTVSGVGFFNHTNSQDLSAMYASVDSVELPEFRQGILNLLKAAGIQFQENHGFTPHITMGWHNLERLEADQLDRVPLTFETLSIVWNEKRQDYPLQG